MKSLFRGLWGFVTFVCILIAIANHNGIETGVKTSDILPVWITFSALCLALPIATFILLMIIFAGMLGVAFMR